MNKFESNTVSSEFLKSGLVEVQGENGAFYPAFIFDVDSTPSSNQPISTASVDSASKPASQSAANVQKSGESLITVTFQNNSFPKSQFPISRIRLPPTSSTSSSNGGNETATVNPDEALKSLSVGISSVHLSNNMSPSNTTPAPTPQPNPTATGLEESALAVGMEVEVLSSCSKDEPRGWWRAIIKMIKGMSTDGHNTALYL